MSELENDLKNSTTINPDGSYYTEKSVIEAAEKYAKLEPLLYELIACDEIPKPDDMDMITFLNRWAAVTADSRKELYPKIKAIIEGTEDES